MSDVMKKYGKMSRVVRNLMHNQQYFIITRGNIVKYGKIIRLSGKVDMICLPNSSIDTNPISYYRN